MPKPTQDEIRATLLQETDFHLAAMQTLGQLKTTRELKFASGSQFAQGGFRELTDLPRLQFLSFTRSALTADDLKEIAHFPRLRHLFLNDCPDIGDGEIIAFARERPTRLEHFWLAKTGITDRSLAAIGDYLSSVLWLDLSGTAITGAGLRHLQTLPKLTTLYVDRTAVTNDGLLTLAALPRLKTITHAGTSITSAGVDALFSAQIALKRKASHTTTPDPATIAATKETLLAFMTAMNAWEIKAHRDLKSTEGFSPAYIARHKPDLEAIFDRYCTERPRVYGHPNLQSVGSPPTYDPQTTKVVEYEQPETHKVMLYTKEHGPQRYQYVLKFVSGAWRIDHRKWQEDSGWHQVSL